MMLVNDVSGKECRVPLARSSTGRLGCSLDGQPYVVPIDFAYESDFFLYSLHHWAKDRMDARQSQGVYRDG
ncbi:MAG: pyridoxamine 5'-phosphate oxidase family protein [Candidatus Sulfotelmatobacter sp.]